MADIKPFRAWRYNADKIENIPDMFSPLFDVVSQSQLDRLYQNSNNSIHLSVPRSQDQAIQKLNEWKAKGIISQDPLPAIYVYYQTFTLYGEHQTYTRKGFISMIRLKKEDIILHENTIAHSVADRVDLLAQTKLNVAPTHALYQDPDHELEALMDSYMAHPLYEYIDYQGVINKLAIVQKPEDIQQFIDKLAPQPVYLADGHHRLESSFVYRDQLAAQGELHPDSIVNHHLMYLTSLDADDLRILPTHRVWMSAQKPNIQACRDALLEYFDLKDVSRSRRPLFDLLKQEEEAFGLVAQGRRWIMKLKADIDPVQMIDLPLPDVLKQLDYTMLHYFVFDKILGIPYVEQGKSQAIRYEKDYYRAVSYVNKGEAGLSFIAKEVKMEQMLEICQTGFKMPQKSTYFYPKVVCGLVFGTIDEHETKSPFDTGFGISEATEPAERSRA